MAHHDKRRLPRHATLPQDRGAGDPHVALWRAVIVRAIEDARFATGIERARAREWLCLHNDDFIAVCTLAGLNPGWVRRRVAAIAADTPDWREWLAAPRRPVRRGPDHQPIAETMAA